MAALEILISRRADVDKAQELKPAPLHYGAMKGHEAVCRRLLEARSNPELVCSYKGRQGFRALVIAGFQGHAIVTEVLLRSQADPCARTENGSTALVYAAQEGHCEVCRLLLASGRQHADDPVANKFERTPMMIACRTGQIGVVKALMEARADPTLTDRTGLAMADFLNECTERKPSEADELRSMLGLAKPPTSVHQRPI